MHSSHSVYISTLVNWPYFVQYLLLILMHTSVMRFVCIHSAMRTRNERAHSCSSLEIRTIRDIVARFWFAQNLSLILMWTSMIPLACIHLAMWRIIQQIDWTTWIMENWHSSFWFNLLLIPGPESWYNENRHSQSFNIVQWD